jgi:hypothetical protein
MGRETDIYLFNKNKASAILYTDLILNNKFEISFEEFIISRKNELSQYNRSNPYNISSKKILEIIENDINEITSTELHELIRYLLDCNRDLKKLDFGDDSWELRTTNLEKYGIILLYEIKPKTQCWSYMFQYGDYTNEYPIEEIRFDNEDQGINIDSTDFLKFNDYVILMMKKILDLELYDDYSYVHTFEMDVLRQTVIEYKDDMTLSKVIENNFNWIKSNWEEEVALGNDNSNAYAQIVYYASGVLRKSIEMKLKIKPSENPRVVIVDSY